MYAKSTFDGLLEVVQGALVGMDQEGEIRFVNYQAERLWGYDRDEMVGQHIRNLVPESLWRIYLEHRESYFADPLSRSMGLDLELRAQHSDGTRFPVSVSLSHIDTGDVLMVVTASSDLLKTKEAFENAQRMATIVENSDDAIIGTTLDGIVTTWNRAARTIFGYSLQEVVGRSADHLVPKDRPGEASDIRAKIKSGESVDHYETLRVRKDGTAIAVSICASPVRDEDGAIVGASAIARDISEKREAFESARSMIESSRDSLVSLRSDGKITDVNAATVKVTGVPRDELIGSAFADFFTDPERATAVQLQVFTEGVAVEDQALTFRHRDGTLTDVLYSASIHHGTGGKVLAIFAAARDVTKIKKAFEAARSMIESSLDSLVAINPEGMITDVNEATVKVTGIPREELLGTPFAGYFTDPERAKRIHQLVSGEAMALDYPLTMRHRDGMLTEVRYNASAYRDADGNVLGTFAAARDVTNEIKAQEEVARQQAKGQDRLAELERFHELTVGRELHMIELKKEIEYLRRLLPADGAEPIDER